MDDGWVGFDLDSTLAVYNKGDGIDTIGAPIAKMVEHLKSYLAAKIKVKIFTARVSGDDPEKIQKQVAMIQEWCKLHIGVVLDVTCIKDFKMIRLYDDRAVQVVPNRGVIV